MKKLIFTLVALLCAGNLWAADTKISDFTADATPTTDDLMVTVNAPATSPANRKVTIANLQTTILAGEKDPATGAITGIVKADGAGNISAAISGTDYEPAGAAAAVIAAAVTESDTTHCPDGASVFTALAGKQAAGSYEPSLGNPETTGWVLSSTDAGVRSWVALPGGGVDFTAYDDVTWGAAAGGSQTHTYDTGAGTDPAVTISDDSFTFNKELVSTKFSIAPTAAGGQYVYFGEDTDFGTNFLGWGVYGDVTASRIHIPPLADPIAGQVMAFAVPGNQTMSDGVSQPVTVATWVTPLTAETNSLETTITGIADTEIFIGTGADAGSFVPLTSMTQDINTTGYVSGQANLVTDAAGAITITVNAVNYGTDTGDADIPDGACDAAGDVGNWVVLITSAADAYSLTSDDASNQFVIAANAAAFAAGNELDVDGTMVSVVCIAAELWKVTGYMGAIPTDGGAAD